MTTETHVELENRRVRYVCSICRKQYKSENWAVKHWLTAEGMHGMLEMWEFGKNPETGRFDGRRIR